MIPSIDNELAKAMVTTMKTVKDDQLNAIAFEALQKTSNLGISSSGVARASFFLGLLPSNGLESLVPAARQAIVKGALMDRNRLMQSADAATTIAKIAFNSPLFSVCIEAVVSTAGPAVIRS